MIIPLAGLLVLLLPAAFGGSLRRLAAVRLKIAWVIALSLLVQVVVIVLIPGEDRLASVAHIGTYLAAAVFVWANRRVPGLLLLGLGGAANGVAIALNGGTLPASAHALRVAGIVEKPGEFANSGVLAHPRLAFLGDVFATPASWPLSNVFSVGDILIVLAVGYASLRICGTRFWAPWVPRTAGHGRPQHLALGGATGPDLAVESGERGQPDETPETVAGRGDGASGRPHLPRQRRRAFTGRVRREPVEIPAHLRLPFGH